MTAQNDDSTERHYVDRKKFNEASAAWVSIYKEAKANGLPKPRLTNYLGECIILIANKAANMPGFVNYPFKDEMIDDGIEIAVRYFHNYDENAISKRTGKKTAGAFGYFTQTVCRAFVKRIVTEKKLMFLRQKYIAQSWDMFVDIQEHDSENFTEELKEILQEMSGDEYKEYDAKIKAKRDAISDEKAAQLILEEELKDLLDNDEDFSIIDRTVSDSVITDIATDMSNANITIDAVKQFFD